MILRVRFKRSSLVVLDSNVANLSIKKSLNQSGEWNFSIPRNTIEELSIEAGDYVEIFLESTILMEGYVGSLTLSAADESIYEVSGRDRTDLLFTKRSWNRALFKNVTAISAIAQLLYTSGWRVNNIETFADAETLISLDLRSEETLMSQVRKILDPFPGVSFRYAGEVAGYPTIDIGSFNEQQTIYISNAPQTELVTDYNTIRIQSISISKSLDLYGKIEAYGGEVTEASGKRQITLKDCLINTPSLAWDFANYRIIEEESGRSYVVVNDDVVEGGTVNLYGDGGTSFYIIGRNLGSGAENLNNKMAFAISTYTGWLKRITFRFGPNSGVPTDLEVSIREHDSITGPSSTKLWTKYYADAAALASTTTVINVEEGTLFLEKDKDYCIVFAELTEPAAASRFNRLEYTITEPKSPYVNSWVSRVIGGGEVWTQGILNTGVGIGTPHISIETYVPESQISSIAITKKWTEYAPENSNVNATTVDIQRAALSMLRRARALLADKSELYRQISITGIGNADFPSLGDKLYVNFHNTTGLYNIVSNQSTNVSDTIQEWLRCYSVGLNYNENGLNWNLQLTDSPLISEEEFFVSVYDNTKDKEALKGVRPSYLVEPSLVTVSSSVPIGTEPNTSYNGLDAYELTIAIPAAPSNYSKALTLICNPVLSSESHPIIKVVTSQDFDYRTSQTAKVIFYSNIGWKNYFSTNYKLYILWV